MSKHNFFISLKSAIHFFYNYAIKKWPSAPLIEWNAFKEFCDYSSINNSDFKQITGTENNYYLSIVPFISHVILSYTLSTPTMWSWVHVGY